MRKTPDHTWDPVLSNGDQPFKLRVSQGLVPGHSFIDKFGRNPLITTVSDPEDVWEGGGAYIYDADGTAPIVSVVSDSASDTMTIVVVGQDINRNEITQLATLTGTTRVALETPLWRVYRMISPWADLTGTVYSYIGTGNTPGASDVRALMQVGNNQTLMALYTIPAGKVGFLWKGSAEVELPDGTPPSSTTQSANCRYYSRRLGEVFTVKRTFTCITSGQSRFKDERSFPDSIPSGTDIKITVDTVTDDLAIDGAFDILLIDEVLFPIPYLKEIGQPGY